MSFVILLSPDQLDQFTEENVVNNFYEVPDDTDIKTVIKKEDLKLLIDRLPPIEADMLEMYFFGQKFQADIGDLFNVSQGAVSYKIRRALERIRFLMKCPVVDIDKMAEDLKDVLPYENSSKFKNTICDNLYLHIMIRVYETSCQSVVAEELGVFQNRVRYRFKKGLEAIVKKAEERPELQIYVDLFTLLSENYNILRPLKIQKRWQHKFKDTLA